MEDSKMLYKEDRRIDQPLNMFDRKSNKDKSLMLVDRNTLVALARKIILIKIQ
jgi:hypothetical protein